MPIKVIDLQSEDAPTEDDYVIIRDNLTNTTRKITLTRLFENPPIGALSITHDMLGLGVVEQENLGDSVNIKARTTTEPSPASLTPNLDNYDIFAVTNLAGAMTINPPIGNIVNGQGLMFRIKDNGTSRSLTWDSVYRAIGVTLPTSTSANKLLYVSGRWNEESQKVDVLAVGRE